MILRRVLEAARRRYALEGQQDRRGFDFDGATQLIFNMAGPAPKATVQWLRAVADGIADERSGGDDAAYEEARLVLHAALTKPTTTNCVGAGLSGTDFGHGMA